MDNREKVKSFVISAFQTHGEVPKVASVAEALDVPPTLVSSVLNALRFAGVIPKLLRNVPKGRLRAAHAIVEFLKEHGRMPTAEEIDVTDRVFKNAKTRLERRGILKVNHTLA